MFGNSKFICHLTSSRPHPLEALKTRPKLSYYHGLLINTGTVVNIQRPSRRYFRLESMCTRSYVAPDATQYTIVLEYPLIG